MGDKLLAVVRLVVERPGQEWLAVWHQRLWRGLALAAVVMAHGALTRELVTGGLPDGLGPVPLGHPRLPVAVVRCGGEEGEGEGGGVCGGRGADRKS